MADLRIGDDFIHGIDLIIFDKDGTLTELHHYWSQMVRLRANLICERLGLESRHVKGIAYEMGADIDSERLRPEGPVGLKKREIVMGAAVDYLKNLGCGDTKTLCTDVFLEVDEVSSRNLGDFVKPIKGAEKLLRSTSLRGCKIAIATTDRRERAKLAMDFLGFGDVVDMIIGADDVTKQKPDPEQIHLILRATGFHRSQAVMVGDALTDVQMGINAGLNASIGVLTGFSSHEQLKQLTTHIAGSVNEIKIL